MRKIVLILASVALCMGQMCGTTGPIPAHEGILAGIYTGQVTMTFTTTYVDGDTSSSSSVNARIATFGQAGLPLTALGTPLRPGDGGTIEVGMGSMEITIMSASVSGNRAAVLSDVSLLIADPVVSSLYTGLRNETYTQLTNNSILLEETATLSGCDSSGNCGTLVFTSTGTLYK